MREMEKDTYTIKVECMNCDFEGDASIGKGVLVPQYILCPNCGCMTASKKQKKISVKIRKPDTDNPWVSFPNHSKPHEDWVRQELGYDVSPPRRGTTFHEGYSDQGP